MSETMPYFLTSSGTGLLPVSAPTVATTGSLSQTELEQDAASIIQEDLENTGLATFTGAFLVLMLKTTAGRSDPSGKRCRALVRVRSFGHGHALLQTVLEIDP
jgi:hypothetical protein